MTDLALLSAFALAIWLPGFLVGMAAGWILKSRSCR